MSIPEKGKILDLGIGNGLLWKMNKDHISTKKVLSEIRRVLTLEGVLYASTIGKDHFKELKALLMAFEPNVDFAPEKVAEHFGLENGQKCVSAYFRKVDVSIYEDALVIPEVDSIIVYVSSVSNARAIFSGAKLENLYRYLENELAKYGTIPVSKASGMFKATG